MRCLHSPMYLLLAGVFAGCTPQEFPDSPTAGPEQKAMNATEEDQGEKDSDVTDEDVRRELSEAAEAVEQYSEQKTQQVLKDSLGNLEEIKEKVTQLKQNLGVLQETAQAEFQESIENLDGKLEDAEKRLDELKDAGSEAWTQAQDNLQNALDSLETAYEEAAAAFDQAKSNGSQSRQPEPAADTSQKTPSETEPPAGSAETPPNDE